MNTDHSGSLEEQVVELRSRVQRLEVALSRQGILSPEFLHQPPTPFAAAVPTSAPPIAWTAEIDQRAITGGAVAPPSPSVAQGQANPAPPVFTVSDSAAGEDERSLENRIASHWFNRIGILAVLIAVAWFLKLAMDNHWIGPLGRVLIGLVAGAAVTAWSERFRSRGYAIFSYGLKAVGSGTLYLSLWAAFSLYHLMPAGAAFAAMILVTAFNGYMAWMQDAELLGLYAIAGAISTPILVSTGENHEITLFTYLLVLNIATLVLVALRPWSRLLFGAAVGTALLFVGWWIRYYSESQFGWTTFFLTCFFLIFAFAPRLVRVDLEDGAPHSPWDHLALVVLPVANAGLGFLAYYFLFDRFNSDWAYAWLAVGFAAFYLLLLRLPAKSVLHESSALLSSLHLTAAVVFLTIAIPLKAQGRWITIGWLVEGAALLWVASRVRLQLLRALALLCLALGFVALLTVNPDAWVTPIFNQRFATYCVGIAVFAFAAWMAFKEKSDSEEQDSGTGSGVWPLTAAIAALTVNFLILLAISLEIHSYWWVLRWNDNSEQFQSYQMCAQFSYSAWFMLFGAVLLCIGFWRRSAFLRWQSLVLMAATIGKVFLYDMSQLSQGYRILSFLGLGALLLAVSFVYQRDWLNLRGGKGEKHEA
jgi:uncharacterized membrane protein